MLGHPVRLEIHDLESAPQALRQLFDAQARPETSWAWFKTLAQTTLAKGESAQIAIVIDSDGTIMSGIPLARIGGGVTRGLTAPYSTLFHPPLGDREQAFQLGQLLARHIDGVLRLDCIDAADASMASFLRGLARGGSTLAVYDHFANWYEEIADFDVYWAARGSRLRSTIKRKTAAATRDGALRFEQCDIGREWKVGTYVYDAIYAKSWKEPEPHAGYIGALLKNLGANGMARLALASIAGELAAAQIWLVCPPRATIFKLAHDPKFDKYSTGSLLTHWLLGELCAKDGVSEVDFGRGDDPYKKDWLQCRRLRQGAIVANPRTVRGLVSIILEIAPTNLSSLIRKTFVRQSTDRDELSSDDA